MKMSARLLAAHLLLGFLVSAHATISNLWGTNGECWSAESRLPDFSFAGYHCGESPLPNVPPGVSVKTFGARGDGVNDDTQAFLDAISKTKNGAIEIPPGRYIITNILEIERSGIVLRGAGADKTVLYFPEPLQEIRPNWSATTEGRKTSEYSWAGGLIWFEGNFGHRALANVAAFKAKQSPPDAWSEAEFNRRDAEVWDLRVATLGAEAAARRSPDDGKRSPVEIY